VTPPSAQSTPSTSRAVKSRFELLFRDVNQTPQVVQVDLSAGQPFVIGSDPGCNLRLQVGGVMPTHCRIELSADGGAQIVNLDNLLTTTVNGSAGVRTPLRDGDQIEFGEASLTVRVGDRAGDASEAKSFSRLSSGSRSGTGNSSSGSRQGLGVGDARVERIDPEVEIAYTEIEAAYPQYIDRWPREQQMQLLQRGFTQARVYGFDTPEMIRQFLHCVFLLGSDLSKASNSDVAYVLDTLTVPSKSRDKRLHRAINLSRRIAEQNHRAAQAPPSLAAETESAAAPPVVGASSAAAAVPESPVSPDVVMSKPVFPATAYPPQDLPLPPLSTGALRGKAPLKNPEPVTAPAAPPLPLPEKAAVHAGSAGATASQLSQTTKPPPETSAADDAPVDGQGFPQIEGFRIIDQIASGGMGTVYRAHDLQLDIDVAIKVLRSLHSNAQQQFLLEARAAAKLQHPHIVPVLRFEQYGQGGYCVMQLIKGTDAHRLIRRFAENASNVLEAHRILEIADLDPAAITPELRALMRVTEPYYRFVAYWMAGVADGLDRAHAEGIIHYDVKPNNMMLASDGRLMLGDFGLATLAERESSSSKSSCIGTPGYLSPEMLAAWACRSGAVETDSRVDIWGLGATMYEFLTLKSAYSGTLAKVLRAIATSDPPRPCDVVWQTPPELQRVCLKAMARNPDERYRRASEMADDLRGFLHGAGKSAARPAKPASGPLSWLKRPQGGP
jgi:serine/threonine protein kinase